MNQVGKVRLYACGGTGINIAKTLNDRDGEARDGIAALSRVFVDTSLTNVDSTVPEESIFIVGRDTASLGNHRSEGSGKNRHANESAIAESIDSIMSKYPPQDLNIVVFNAAGGTGSVAGPFIMNWLLEMGQNAVAMVIGNEVSAQAASNTFATMKTLERISDRNESPLTIIYLHQPRHVTRAQIDATAVGNIASLSILASRQNDELDLEDIHNLFNYTEVCDIAPQLTLLEIFTDQESVEQCYEDVSVIGMSALMGDKQTPMPNVKSLYDAVGYYDPNHHGEGMTDLFFVVTTHGIDRILTIMQDNEEEAVRILTSQSKRVSFADSASKSRSKGKQSTTGLL